MLASSLTKCSTTKLALLLAPVPEVKRNDDFDIVVPVVYLLLAARSAGVVTLSSNLVIVVTVSIGRDYIRSVIRIFACGVNVAGKNIRLPKKRAVEF